MGGSVNSGVCQGGPFPAPFKISSFWWKPWDSTGTPWRVAVRSGLMGIFFPGRDGAELRDYGLQADAPAVVDDFGNLVIVGRWE